MQLKRLHWMGIIAAVILIAGSLLFFRDNQNLLFFIVGLALAIGILPFIIDLIFENRREQNMSEMFLEFTRNLAESVSTGTPISKSIINGARKNYGDLTPYVVKLANQISLGIPVNKALQTFSHEVDNPVVSRAIALISEAERAGGEIDYILDSVSRSIAEVEKLKKERQAAISGLITQGYIIFFIFIAIMLVMEYKILPLATQVGSIGGLSGGGENLIANKSISANGYNSDATQKLGSLFLYLLLAQGFFTGLTIGKLAEGSLKAGIKHSFIMMISAFLLSSGARVFLGPPGA